MLTTISWPRSAVPSGVFTDYSRLIPQDGQEARRAKRALSQGELLLMSKVSKFGEKVTIVQTLGVNTRAMAIKVDATTAVGGFVTPGDRVDIVMTQGKEYQYARRDDYAEYSHYRCRSDIGRTIKYA